jgi:hypothetical protein
MKRSTLLILLFSLLILLGAAWGFFIHGVNSQTTPVTVWVSGSIDEVQIFPRSAPNRVLAIIQTIGLDAQTEIQLPRSEKAEYFFQSPPAQYVFLAQSGSQHYESSPFCCTIGLRPDQRVLKIHSLENWEVTSSEE